MKGESPGAASNLAAMFESPLSFQSDTGVQLSPSEISGLPGGGHWAAYSIPHERRKLWVRGTIESTRRTHGLLFLFMVTGAVLPAFRIAPARFMLMNAPPHSLFLGIRRFRACFVT